MLAEARCCPKDQCKNLTFQDPSDQCLEGTTGALCLVCAQDYVPASSSMECTPCEGGADLGLAFVAMFGMICVPVFFTVLFFLLSGIKHEKVETAETIFGQIKILISFLQIMSSMPTVMESVPWPEAFLSFSVPFTAVNLDFMGLFSASVCNLSVRFPHRFLISMTVPVCLAVVIALALVSANICAKDKSPKGKVFRKARSSKVAIVLILFIYPGLCEKIFTVLRCKTIVGIDDGDVLVADWAMRCHQGDHLVYSALAFVFGILYVAGCPLGMLYVLYRNRKALYDESHPDHHHVFYMYEGLYGNLEERYYYFEIVNVIHKMLMTGAMVVISPGTSTQPLVATLFQMGYLLLVLKTAPFISDADDYSSFSSALSLALSMLCGFAIMADEGKAPSSQDFGDSNVAGMLLVGVSCTSLAVNLLIMCYSKNWMQLTWCKNTSDAAVTKIVPEKEVFNETGALTSQERHDQLSEIRKKFGAGSPEYAAAARNL